MTSQTDKWVQFAFSHQTLIIEGIFAVILAVIVIWLFTNLNQENEKKSNPHSQSHGTQGINPELEAALKKLVANQAVAGTPTGQTSASTPVTPKSPGTPVPIFGAPTTPAQTSTGQPVPTIFSNPNATGSSAQTAPAQTSIAKPVVETPSTQAMKPAAVKAPEVVPGSAEPVAASKLVTGAAPSDSELQKLKEETEGQKKRINDLLSSLDQTRVDLNNAKEELAKGGDVSELQNRIAILEARLQEYEVIEDDIANLSVYKKENEQLKRELSELRNAQGDAPAASPSWPINNEQQAMRPLKPVDTKKPEVVAEEAGAKEGEKLLMEFQKFMKGSSNG